MAATWTSTAIAAAACGAAAPWLAGLTLTVPDRAAARWWRPRRAAGPRVAATAGVGVILGGLAGAAAGSFAALPAFLALALLTTPLVVIDFEHHRLPDRLVAPAALSAAGLLGLAAAVDDRWTDYVRAAEAAAAVLAVLGLLFLASPRSFGLGDVKLGAVLGGYLGWSGWPAVYYGVFAGFLLGSVVGVALLVSRRASLRSALAFGPMLVLGALVVLAFDIAPALPG